MLWLRSPFFFVLSILCSDKTDLFDVRLGIHNVDHHVRASLEALVLHAWYVDLWDVRSDDHVAWSPNTFRNIVAFVERDRQTIYGRGNDGNLEVCDVRCVDCSC